MHTVLDENLGQCISKVSKELGNTTTEREVCEPRIIAGEKMFFKNILGISSMTQVKVPVGVGEGGPGLP